MQNRKTLEVFKKKNKKNCNQPDVNEAVSNMHKMRLLDGGSACVQQQKCEFLCFKALLFRIDLIIDFSLYSFNCI